MESGCRCREIVENYRIVLTGIVDVAKANDTLQERKTGFRIVHDIHGVDLGRLRIVRVEGDAKEPGFCVIRDFLQSGEWL